MKQRPKEILKNKADKMIDLIIDEIEEGGEKQIVSAFKKNSLRYELTVQLRVSDASTTQTIIIDSEETNGS